MKHLQQSSKLLHLHLLLKRRRQSLKRLHLSLKFLQQLLKLRPQLLMHLPANHV